MIGEEQRIIDLMKSWETGYIAPSAQMVFRDARVMLEEKIREVNKLRGELYDLRTGCGDDPGGAKRDDQPAESKAPRKLRGKKST